MAELMTDKLDDFIKITQAQIISDLRETYSVEAIERWINPDNMGSIDNPDAHASLKGRCGDTMDIFLNFRDGKVEKASYVTDGCASSNICGSFAAAMATGKTPDEIIDVTGESILDRMGNNVPEDDRHCAFLAAETLQEALDVYMKKQRYK
jgi:nitrogen fixation NifU-like protein